MHPGSNDTNQYLQSFKKGEEAGFSYFFERYYPALCFFARRYLGDADDAKDVVEESFVNIWAKREQMETESGLRGYLYKTVYNACLRWKQKENRNKKKIQEYSLIRSSTEYNLIEGMLRAEMLRLLRDAMDNLPPQCKKIFYKLYIEGKSTYETAIELGLAVSTVKNQRMRGIRLLRLKLSIYCLVIFTALVTSA